MNLVQNTAGLGRSLANWKVRRCESILKALAVATISVGCMSASAGQQRVPGCGDLHNPYGPFDYTNREHFSKYLPVVEAHHFTPEIERLQPHERYHRNPMADISYTLRAFPNHHRALQSMAIYALRSKQSPPPMSPYTAECWFKRAIAFRPEDGVVKMIYGTYLFRKGDLVNAEEQYDKAKELLGDNVDLDYNLGLLYFDKGEFDLAYEYARKAYDAGFPLPGLKGKLKETGHWKHE